MQWQPKKLKWERIDEKFALYRAINPITQTPYSIRDYSTDSAPKFVSFGIPFENMKEFGTLEEAQEAFQDLFEASWRSVSELVEQTNNEALSHDELTLLEGLYQRPLDIPFSSNPTHFSVILTSFAERGFASEKVINRGIGQFLKLRYSILPKGIAVLKAVQNA